MFLSLCRIILFVCLLLLPSIAIGAVTLVGGEFSSSLDCTTYDPSCDGFGFNQSSDVTQCGEASTLSLANNNPLGTGRALQIVLADGSNAYTSTYYMDVDSSPLSEVWIRWYAKYESGFAWDPLSYDKMLYLYLESASYNMPLEMESTQIRLLQMPTQGDATSELKNTSWGWNTVMGGATGDGAWHSYEIHFKVDTDTTDGEFHMWVDGSATWSRTNVNYAQNKLEWFIWKNNQSDPNNSTCAYLWLDDIAISTNGYIGPLAAGSSGSTITIGSGSTLTLGSGSTFTIQ